MTTFPGWLHALSLLSVVVAIGCAAIIAVDVRRHPQKMAVMNVVWPVTALFGSVLWLFGYFRWGRARRGQAETAMPVAVAVAASHCGAGCTIGDIVAESLVVIVPGIAVVFGWGTLFAEKTFAVWVLDFILAFLLGIVFQYFTIQPMRRLPPAQGLVAALKADAASITAWQVGMYGGMALIQFAWWRAAFGGLAQATQPEFWFAMQAAMLCGFATSYPVNWWLVHIGVKEKM